VLSRLSARKTDARFNCFVQRPSDAFRLAMETGDAPSGGLPAMRTERGGALAATVSGLSGGGSAQTRIAVSRPWIEWLDDSLVGDAVEMDMPDETATAGAKFGAPRTKLLGDQGGAAAAPPRAPRPPVILYVEGQERAFRLRIHMDDPPDYVPGRPTYTRRRYLLHVEDMPIVVYGEGTTTVELAGQRPGTPESPAAVRPNATGATDVAGKVNPVSVVPNATGGGFVVQVTVKGPTPEQPTQRKVVFRQPVQYALIHFGFDGDGDRKVDFGTSGDILGVAPENLRPDAKRMLFWANTDNDCADGAFTDVGTQDDSLPEGEDARHNSIRCARDLEDYTRAAIWLSENPGDLRFELGMDVVGSGGPSVRMFETDSDGTADLQACAVAASSLVPLVGRAEHGTVAPLARAPRAGVTTYLVDASKPGRGNMQLIVSKDNRHVARLVVPVDFRAIDSFIEEYSLGDWEDGYGKTIPAPLAAARRVRTYQSPCDYDAAPGDNGSGAAPAAGCALDGTYVLFIHGHNYTPLAKEAWSATLFKRLWWVGYRGHFGYLRWPAGEWSGIVDTARHREVFNDGEFNGWRSGSGLFELLRALRARYPKVVVIAHSHGAVPLAEALRIARDRGKSDLLDTVITSEGALGSGYLMKWPPHPSRAEYLVPQPWDVGNKFRTEARETLPYLWGIENGVSRHWWNYANTEDFAVGDGRGLKNGRYGWLSPEGSAWVVNNNSKPLASRDFGWNDDEKKYYFGARTNVLDPQMEGEDRFRVFAYGNRGVGLPIGGISASASPVALGMASRDKFETIDSAPFGFGVLQADHSGAFVGAACKRWALYPEWLKQFPKN